jgi:VIT1/CCC1 family predicted Fe2+/Mn2+ transporter
MHLSEESRLDEKSASIWMISLYTFLAKLLFSLVFLIPVLSLDLASAVRFSVVFGVLLIMILASIVAYRRKESWLKQSIGNGLLAIVVVITSYFLGHIAARIK